MAINSIRGTESTVNRIDGPRVGSPASPGPGMRLLDDPAQAAGGNRGFSALAASWKALEQILEMRYGGVAATLAGKSDDLAGPQALLARVADLRQKAGDRFPPDIRKALDQLQAELGSAGVHSTSAAPGAPVELKRGQRTRHFEVLRHDGNVADVGLSNGAVVNLDKRSSQMSLSDPQTGQRRRILGEPIIPGRNLSVATKGVSLDVETKQSPENRHSNDVLMRQGDDTVIIKGLDLSDRNRLTLQAARANNGSDPAKEERLAGGMNALLNAVAGDVHAPRPGQSPAGQRDDPRDRLVRELLSTARDGLRNASAALPPAHGGMIPG